MKNTAKPPRFALLNRCFYDRHPHRHLPNRRRLQPLTRQQRVPVVGFIVATALEQSMPEEL